MYWSFYFPYSEFLLDPLFTFEEFLILWEDKIEGKVFDT